MCNLSQEHNSAMFNSSTIVAVQCLETTFKISSSDCHLAVTQPLTEIFLNALLKVGAAQSTSLVFSYASETNISTKWVNI